VGARVPLFDVISAGTYRQLGALTARMHAHAADFIPFAEPIRWDKVFYFPNEIVVLDDPNYSHRLTARMRSFVAECIEAVSPTLRSLYDTPGRLIHADLHGWNVNVYRGGLTILDFDDVMWGQPVHDIAITYGYKRDYPAYPGWIEACEEGYRSVAEWPVQDQTHVEALMVARRLMFTNYVLTFPDDISEYLTVWEKHFEEYLGA
jgi:Ser/Thr protein kinase RdoA (MazF antagonist)